MTTVYYDAAQHNMKAKLERLNALRAMGNVPNMVLHGAEAALNNCLVKCSKGETFEVEFTSQEVKTGRGGKQYSVYTTVDNRKAYYFPHGRFGPFLSWSEKG